MKKVLIVLLLLLVLLVGGLVVGGLALPTEYRVERELSIAAPAARIHPYLADLEQWPSWAPWEEDDPTIVTTYGDVTVGAGASQTWTSENGDGELTLTRADPATGIAYDMAFIMEGTRAPSVCAMDYRPDGENTVVVWTMEGDCADMMPPVVSGYMAYFLEGEIGKMFDRGLTKLKGVVEGESEG